MALVRILNDLLGGLINELQKCGRRGCRKRLKRRRTGPSDRIIIINDEMQMNDDINEDK